MNYELFIIFERISRLLNKLEKNAPQKLRATSGMWLLLSFIGENSPVTGTDVAGRFMITHPTATQLIDRAVSDGYVEMTPGTGDRRVKYLTLTSEGEKQRSLLRRYFDKRASRALKYLSTDEHQQLLSLMAKMASGLELETATTKAIDE